MNEILHVGYTCKMLPNHAIKSKCVDTKFCARGQFSKKWLPDIMSETANGTKMPMIPKEALEAWALQ